jgi:hypothetical protein
MTATQKPAQQSAQNDQNDQFQSDPVFKLNCFQTAGQFVQQLLRTTSTADDPYYIF